MPKTNTASGIRAEVNADHRDGQGNLIARSVSIQPPPPPKCLKPKCIYKFFKDCIFSSLLADYHRRRVTYAEANRHKKIPEKYRSGDNAPQTIWQAMFAIIKLGGKQWLKHK